MTKNDKIHIKLEICKDKTSGELTIMTRFDSNAPNFSKDKDGYSWWPTVEEKDFINEAFDLMSPYPIESIPSEKTVFEPPEKKEEIPEEKLSQFEKKEEIPEKNLSPFEKKEEKKPADLSLLEKNEEEAVFGVEEEKTKSNDKAVKEDKQVLVQADEEAIEAALKKTEEKDESIVEADEQTIIDKVLRQKKKGKWTRER